LARSGFGVIQRVEGLKPQIEAQTLANLERPVHVGIQVEKSGRQVRPVPVEPVYGMVRCAAQCASKRRDSGDPGLLYRLTRRRQVGHVHFRVAP
jgi:hypothetical protein